MDYIFLSRTGLFRGSSPEETERIVGGLGARVKAYQKGEYIYRAGDCICEMGIVLSGSVNIESDDLWGNRSILNHIAPGQIFAETYACIPGEPMMVSVAADETAEVLFLDMARLLESGAGACPHRERLVNNLLSATAQKNLNLSRRIMHTSAKTIRGRLLSYLSFQAARHGSNDITIPYNRQQLADYLSVDRSALSKELGRLQREGTLEVQKNHFLLCGSLEGRDDYAEHESGKVYEQPVGGVQGGK